MKATGIVRQIDVLGRIVLPMELRRTKGIEERDPIEIFVDGDNIVLRKYQPECIFCGTLENVTEHKGAKICEECLVAVKTLAKRKDA